MEIADALEDKNLQCGCTANLGLVNWQRGNPDVAGGLSDRRGVRDILSDKADMRLDTENLGSFIAPQVAYAARAAIAKR